MAPLPAIAQEQDIDFSSLKPDRTITIAKIIDGKLIEARDGTIIRLSEVEIPTTYKNNEFDIQAKELLEKAAKGKQARLYVTQNPKRGRINRFGHSMAHIVIKNGPHLQSLLVSKGVARALGSPDNYEMNEQLNATESLAIKDQKGVWKDLFFSIKNPDNIERFLNSYQIAEGTIVSAASRSNRIYLNFGEDWKEDFTVSIAPERRKEFSRLNLNPLDWVGKKIRVRGWVEKYNGPYVDILHPSRIELFD